MGANVDVSFGLDTILMQRLLLIQLTVLFMLEHCRCSFEAGQWIIFGNALQNDTDDIAPVFFQ